MRFGTEQNKFLVYGIIGFGVLGFLVSFALGGVFSLIGASILGIAVLLSVGLLKFGYVFLPLITRAANITTRLGDYEIPSSQDVIIKKEGPIYYASAYLGIRIYEPATEKSIEENVQYNKFFERAISNFKHVTQITYMLYAEDVKKKRESIEARRSEFQLRLNKEREKPNPDVLAIDKYEKTVAYYDLQLNRIIRGEKPMAVIAYAMTTATGPSKEAAIAAVRTQADELKTTLSNALNVEVTWLTADEMLKCFEWRRFAPITVKEMESSVV